MKIALFNTFRNLNVLLAKVGLDGKTLSDYTTEGWLRKKVKTGEKVTVYMKIPFEEIEGRYTDDTIVVYYSWGMYGSKKEFKL